MTASGHENESINELRSEFQGCSAEDVLLKVWQRFGHSAGMSSSFQTQSVPLLYMVSRVAPEVPIIFVDTGYHFPETLAFRDRLTAAWGLNVRTVRALPPSAIGADRRDLYRTDPDSCCRLHKVEPFRRSMRDYGVWISGIRRDQTDSRSHLGIVEEGPGGTIRIHPMLTWNEADLWSYMSTHDLPKHPLYDKGYPSIGCAPCTMPISLEEDARRGRWKGKEKTECGLHTDLVNLEDRREFRDRET